MNPIILSGEKCIPRNAHSRKYAFHIKWFLLIFFLFSALINYGQAPQTFTYTTSGTWVCPAGVTSITVECWGGGGAGGGSIWISGDNAGAGGGGGGYTKTTSVLVTPVNNPYTIIVGQGGIGNANVLTGSINGSNGGDSYFGASIGIAHGGNGGGGNGGSAGAGGTGGTWNGGNGAAAKSATISGGGGGGAGSGSNGGNANQDTPGSGGTGNSSGSGGAGISTNVAGNSGSSIGGGGSGAGQAMILSPFKGGPGANGEVIITNTTPPTITGLSSNICAGGSITITGTNFVGITLANVTIGGTAVSSITSASNTQIVAVVNAACTGTVKVTTGYGTATSAGSFTVNPVSVGGVVNSSATVCSGTNSGTLNLTGQIGNVLKWQYSTDGGTTWTAIANTTTSQTYTNLTLTTQYRAVVQSGVCTSVNSSAATITVNPVSVGGAVNSNTTVCSGTNSGTVNLTGNTGSVVKWQYSTDGGSTWTDIVNTTTSQPYNNLTQTTIGRAVVQNGACPSANSNPVTITVKSTGSWAGSVSNDWNDSRNWICGQVPTSAINVTIQSGASSYPVISSGIAYANNVTIQSGGSLTVTGGNLQIFGAITNSFGTFDATNGTIEMKGASAQTIDGSMFYNKTINNLIVSNTGSGLSVASTSNDTLKITGTLSFGNGSSILNTGDNITLVSNNAGTANVGVVGSGNTINGNVTVERYINIGTASGQHAKSWQFLATPTIGQSVKESWMENGSTPVGYGTQITGAGGTVAGFDAYTASPSLKYYNPSSDAWVGITGSSIPIYNQNGYMVFVRGDRSVTSVTQPANNTTLRTKGTLITGITSPITVIPDKYASVGNPYASPVDFTQIHKGIGIDPKFYVWDPYLYGSYGVGGYQTMNSASEYKPVPGGTSTYPSGIPSYIIQSGQAFFVHATSNPAYSGPDYQLYFGEDSKATGVPSKNVSREAGIVPSASRQFFGVSLFTGTNAASNIADGNMVAFDKGFSDDVDGDDALKIANGGENFGLKRNGKSLAIEARAPLAVTDTLFYNMSNLLRQTYQLRFAPVNMQSAGLQAYLIDKFLNTSTPISLTDSSFINISVTSNAASSAANRFEVVFRTLSVAPVTFTSITAVQKNADIEVDWKVENESGIQQYEVEESGDGNQFVKVATVAPQNNGTGNYSWLDLNVTTGYHYYRVRSVGKDGQVQYTQIVKVLIGRQNASISVYPNPIVNGNIHLQFNNQPAGTYGIRLLNSLGQVIVLKVINHGGGNAMEEITPRRKLATGIYQLEITKPDGNIEDVKVVN